MTNRKAGTKRFGKIEKIEIRKTRQGKDYATIVVNCKRFKQTAFAFGEDMVERLKSIGEGSNIWLVGVFEPIERDGHTEYQMRIVYIGDNAGGTGAVPADARAGTENDPVAETTPDQLPNDLPNDLTVIKGIGAAVAEKLNAAGVETYAALAEMTDEALDAVAKGTAKRATSGNWRAIAAELATEGKSVSVDDNEEIPF